MGIITIQMTGSFKGSPKTASFSAVQHGHAQAVAEAIQFLAQEVLPGAINQDHELHDQGQRPHKEFGREQK